MAFSRKEISVTSNTDNTSCCTQIYAFDFQFIKDFGADNEQQRPDPFMKQLLLQ